MKAPYTQILIDSRPIFSGEEMEEKLKSYGKIC